MSRPFPQRAVAGCFALTCFGVALMSGLMANRSSDEILKSAIVALLGGQIVGHLFACALARTFAEAFVSQARRPASAEAGTPTAERRA